MGVCSGASFVNSFSVSCVVGGGVLFVGSLAVSGEACAGEGMLADSSCSECGEEGGEGEREREGEGGAE